MYKTTRIHCVLFVVSCLLVACGEEPSSTRNIESYLDSAQSYLDKGQYRAAIIEIQNAFKLDPSNEAAAIIAARISLGRGIPKQAYRRLELTRGESYDYFRILVEAYIESRKYNSALAVLLQQKSLFKSNPIEQKLLTSRAYAGLGQFDKAEPLLKEILNVDPDNLDARLVEVSYLVIRGDLEAAESKVKDVLSIESGNIDALKWMSIVYLQQGRLDLAEEALTNTIAALPVTDIFTRERSGILKTMIAVLARQGRSGEALVYQRILAEEFPNAQQFKDMFIEALENIQEGKIAEAENVLLELYEQSPGNETGGAVLGVLNFVRGRDEQARRFFSEAVDIETASPRLLTAVALNLLRMNQPAKVIEALESRISITRDPQILAVYGVAALSAGMADKGVAALSKAIDLYPENTRLRLLLASHYNSQSPPDYESGYEVLNLGYAITPLSPEITVAMLDQLVLMGRRAEGEEIVAELLRSKPDDYFANLMVGAFWLRVNEATKAIGNYRRASELEKSRKPPLFGLASANLKEQRWDQAKSAFRKIITLDSSDSRALNGLFQAYVGEGDVAAGIDELTGLAKESEESFGAVAGVITGHYTRTNSFSEADAYLQKLSSRSAENGQIKQLTAEFNYRRAQAAIAEKNYSEARTSVFEALELFPRNRSLLRLLTIIEIQSGQLGEAEKVLQDIKTQHPSDPMVPEMSGDIEIARKNYVQARRDYQSAFNLAPSDALGLKMMATLKELGTTDAAETFAQDWKEKIPTSLIPVISRVNLFPQDNRRAISLYEEQNSESPNNPVVLNNLAWFYFQEGELNRGLQSAQEAYRLAPSNPSIVDTYGWLLYKTGETENSLEILRKAVAMAPRDAEIKEHLDTVLAKVE